MKYVFPASILILISLLLDIGCQSSVSNKDTQDSTNVPKTAVHRDSSANTDKDDGFGNAQQVFKRFMRDTVSVLIARTKSFPEEGWFRRTFEVPEDSSSLQILHCYAFEYPKRTHSQGELPKWAMALLKKHRELPRGPIIVNLAMQMQYYFYSPDRPIWFEQSIPWFEIIAEEGREISRYHIVKGALGSDKLIRVESRSGAYEYFLSDITDSVQNPHKRYEVQAKSWLPRLSCFE